MMNNNGIIPKIVQIETRYVETDPINFRQVVQSLTGNNSSMPIITQQQEQEQEASYRHGSVGANKPLQELVSLNHHAATTNVSFKDFDALLLSDLPSFHDLLYYA
ncbi:hypothetical protein PIB30_015710 [Stylosanthes scabra]|uniref:VQ domain-containing protein n=1 Tax=Stylosanthes scabra TaxID=79078 RepID=A0ABU6W5I2_9FABA|nr:hypothetical protein [Stylosanthes scabra]